jgi:HD-GYP domain-containing protein (c-di-GMP phosphodiesterase class II)
VETKVPTTDLRIGMFVADLDRPWVDTPFLLQGFLIEGDAQIRELQQHCVWVVVDRARSLGDEYEPPLATTNTIPPKRLTAQQIEALARAEGRAPEPPPKRAVRDEAKKGAGDPKVIRLEDVLARRTPGAGGAVPARPNQPGSDEPGVLGRALGAMKGLFKRGGKNAATPEGPVTFPQLEETPQELAARAALLPPGIAVQTYRDTVPVEEEVERARVVVQRTDEVLEKMVADIRAGNLMEIEEVEEVVNEMVESIVRNPDALMWVARLREQDITTYGHSLQVAVYMTAFGRQLGFPKPQLALLGQVGLLLDIGKIKLPRELLEKEGKLSAEEFAEAKQHVQYGLDILASTPNFHPEVIEGIFHHHERMNGSGYPSGLVGTDISLFGRMAGISDCFAAITKRRPYADAVSSYEAMRSLSGWAGDYFQEALVQQFISSVGVFPVGSLIELNTGEVAIVVAHNKVRRLKPRVLLVTGPDKTPAGYPSLLDLLYDPKTTNDQPIFIRRGLAAGAFGLDLRDFYLA